MRKLFLAAVATLATVVGSVTLAGTASAATPVLGDSSHSQVYVPVPFLFNETG
jgi:hypothetical protein